MPDMEKNFPGLSRTLLDMKHQEEMTLESKAVLVKFIDEFVSCSIQNEDGKLNSIVEEVQTHQHSRTCTKRGHSTCRFGYPKCPSDKTLIAVPLNPADFENEAAMKKKEKGYENIISSVKEVLTNFDEVYKDREPKTVTISDVLERACVTEEDYYEALQVSKRGITIVLRRQPFERNINNYNPLWLTAWNANMDIQPCIDYFAVITYITDYYSKDETGTQQFLLEAVKQLRGQSQKEKMRTLANVFMTHRQLGKYEAFYRIFPHLHLSESTVKCIFVATGFPDNRSQFLQKVHSEEAEFDEEGNEVETLDKESDSSARYVKVANNNNRYILQTSIHDKYAARPTYLEDMCFAQFAMCYTTVPFARATRKEFLGEVSIEFDTDKTIVTQKEDQAKPLPKVIQISLETEQGEKKTNYILITDSLPI